ncbi:MAG: PTS sugar transporter subunit IIA [Anaerolineaceae bacterium]|jgi:mannitol/fructose-specific phosphotransferase system IIA component|nr:PTS sugar transporter subunit IIA [Anaerolineaceae bacterium]
MGMLAIERIQLGAKADDKVDAIRLAGELLVAGGCVTPEYIEGMQERERSMSTYLGVGVSIPHGMYENYTHIMRSGLSVLQIPDGVAWEEGENVYLVIGIASSSDEHMHVLQSLAEALEDEEKLQLLIHTADPQQVIDVLEGVSTE